MGGPAQAGIPELLQDLRERLEGERVTVDTIAEGTGRRGHGLLLLVLALPETIPMVGVSAVLAVPILLLGLGMLWHGVEVPLPGILARRTIRRDLVERAIDRALPLLRRLERVLRPRWPALAQAGRVQGIACVLLAVVLAVPVPGVNFLAAVGVAGIGLGILQRDGVAITVALVSGTLAVGGLVAVFLGAGALIGLA